MPDPSIKFIPIKNPTPDRRADFVLDEDGDPPGPFNVFQGDLVSWNNTTGDEHQPAVYKPIDAGKPPVGTPDPIGGIMPPRTFLITFSHVSAPAAGAARSTVSNSRPAVFVRWL